MKKAGRGHLGFTIVELLVVIVIIGILAAVTLVSFSGGSARAIVASIKSDLSGSARQLKLYNVTYGEYPSSLDGSNCPSAPTADGKYCLKFSGDNQLESYTRPTAQSFVLVIKNGNKSYQITESTEPESPPIFSSGGVIAASGGYRTHTFTAGATITAARSGTIEVTAVGAGGGGGRQDMGGETAGYSGDKVVASIAVNLGEVFTIVVGQGGRVSVTENTAGGVGGSGYTNGATGGLGESGGSPCGYGWSFGGSGGGGSTGIRRGATRLVEAKGGNGGNSADGYIECEVPYGEGYDSGSWGGGAGGAGGGSNYPSLTTQYGGANGGAVGANGATGNLVIRYSYEP